MAEAGSSDNMPDTSAPPQTSRSPAARIVIKKYANRRLYNTGSSSYVTLEHLSDMVKKGVDFVVYDARTNEDITRQVLTQIIFEAENSGQNLLPIQFLRQLIKLYGNQIQALVPGYLEMSLDAFARQQDSMREQVGATLGGGFATPPFPGADGYRLFEEQVRQNMALFDRAMKMFTPFAYGRSEGPTGPSAAEPPPPSTGDEGVSMAELRARMDEMQRQIERLAGKG